VRNWRRAFGSCCDHIPESAVALSLSGGERTGHTMVPLPWEGGGSSIQHRLGGGRYGSFGITSHRIKYTKIPGNATDRIDSKT
jgi:hypothetical protein